MFIFTQVNTIILLKGYKLHFMLTSLLNVLMKIWPYVLYAVANQKEPLLARSIQMLHELHE